MPLPEFSQARYLSTMISPMTNVTETADPSVNIWPAVHMLVNTNLIPSLVVEKQLIEAVYRNKTGTYDHVLLPTSQSKIFLCIIVNNNQKEIEGFYVLDLSKEYSLAGARMGRVEKFAGDGATADLQLLFASGYSQEEIDSALENAIAYSQLETAEYLLSLGADFASNGYNGVYYAAYNNELEGLKFAISKGVDVNVEDGMPLNVAVETACNTKSKEMIEWLLQHGADIRLLTPGTIERAMSWGNDELKAILGVRQLESKRSPWWKFWQ
ncbi:ankyrin repeat domain-containing protein [Flavitalea sp. BT771]|uniref:ankyrin repeat domain-containing protein n=1 Tax=Flavitalea sp. BT771 TaxID=3063329 RepID=UPI0026E25AEF|nr:ankyrin repeat domain-containing protein [Flavitalea sp. BT771]MDO6429655.1 ankyrin repeat domain-containing protein [Flavitalea sp. BT771]MDV6218217.1 ankyrin repeat domain-containing protein [Flavitalea sp. BT771]